MSTGKTYSTKYLLDSNNNRGSEGQILSTTSTGIDWVDANSVPGTGLWVTSGNSIYNSNSGNIGIGTASPAKQLVVRSSAPWIRIEEDSASNKRLDLWVDPTSAIGYIGANQSAQQLSFQTGSSDRIRILNNGNVGIGVTGPVAPLDVFGAAVQNGSTPGIKLSSSNTQQTVFAIGNTGTRQYELAVGGTTSSVPGAFYIYDNNAADFRITLATSGNVGIGTTSPNEKLHVAGNIHAFDTSADRALFASTAAGSTTIAVRSSGITHFNGGNVGIGTTSPQSLLHLTHAILFYY